MRRWSIALIFMAVIVYALFPREQDSARPVIVSAPKNLRAPAQQILVLAPQVRAPATAAKNTARSKSAIRLGRKEVQARSGFEQSGRRWRWLSGAVAIRAQDHLAHLPRLSERPGFWVIAATDLPAGVAGLPLVEREDNGLVGIFTGVLKAVGKASLQSSGQFQSVCPCEIEQAYPQIKSYLLATGQGQSHVELRTCLEGTGLFKRLDWEILDHPNSSL